MNRLRRRVAGVILALGYGHGPRLASALRKRWAQLRNPNARLQFGPGVYAGPGFSIHAPAGGAFTVGPGVEFRRNFRLELGTPDARVSVGAGCYFTYDVIIACSTSIDIGERAVIGANAVVSRAIPPFTVAAGVPARVVDYFGPPGREPPDWTEH